jgi:hypothetical protein
MQGKKGMVLNLWRLAFVLQTCCRKVFIFVRVWGRDESHPVICSGKVFYGCAGKEGINKHCIDERINGQQFY